MSRHFNPYRQRDIQRSQQRERLRIQREKLNAESDSRNAERVECDSCGVAVIAETLDADGLCCGCHDQKGTP